MPYINKNQRGILQSTLNLEDVIEKLGSAEPTVGDLNYIITRIVHRYFELHNSYQGINDIVGVLECAKIEFYRRLAVPYEEEKIKSNGDV